ncbi:NnrS family protein [methane-oxidizing endosymbiont of Gigantopelta aegis]|uniref:NnrS family protein n=1 Tax=methane-oxidizing endosymbiont of Gigantopelta aegis TaxID=2794938 RepID=UPI0018DBBE4C|nr:NnrS family protein [methane-oxidizing endosymbiont of Gigantopelta aegis]
MNKKPIFNYPLFALGFRTFFLLAGLSALLLISLWNNIYDGRLHTDLYFPTVYWHAHEMLLGYSTAVIAGFLLTAVKNWTGRETTTPDQLAGLGLLWLYGRIMPFYSELIPDVLIAAVDFAFLPWLAWLISRPLLAAANYRNLIFILMLALMATGNGLLHLEILGVTDNTGWQGITLVVMVILSMILVLAGRVFPFFTERGLKGVMAIRNPALDIAGVAFAVVSFGLVLVGVKGALLATVAVLALIVNLARVWGWYNPKIWYVPLLWVLYLGYAWILLGFAMLALSAYGVVSYSVALHAFTVGGIGVITLGMMARVALGHTGRVLRASNAIAVGFVLINLAALFRVLLPSVFPAGYDTWLLISSYIWLAAFALFFLVYSPILTSPRVDGQPG